MFENLRRAFREAVDNFHRELDRDRLGGTVDGLLRRMEQEAAGTLATLKGLEEQIGGVRERAERELKEAKVCRRRESLAVKIGDSETAQVAAEYAEKHEARHQVLDRKREAIEAEIRLLRSEYGEMCAEIKKARSSRDDLSARQGRVRATESLRGADDLFGELDRMADKIHRRDGARSVDDALFGNERAFEELEDSRREAEVGQRLDELKRRMGRK